MSEGHIDHMLMRRDTPKQSALDAIWDSIDNGKCVRISPENETQRQGVVEELAQRGGLVAASEGPESCWELTYTGSIDGSDWTVTVERIYPSSFEDDELDDLVLSLPESEE